MVFKKLFGKKKLSQPVSLSPLVADMHSHLIPGIDDGVGTLEDSIDLIRKLNGLGYSKLITTPHIQQEFFRNTPTIIKAGLQDVRKAIQDENIPVTLEAAAEYLVDDGFQEKIDEGDLLTFGDKYILIELSYFNPHPNIKGIIFNLQVDGYKVILAHPERYSYWFNDWKKFEELKDRGVFFQVNAISLGGYYPDPVNKIAAKFIDEGMIEFIGTDLHNTRYFEALERARFEPSLDRLINSGKILNDTL